MTGKTLATIHIAHATGAVILTHSQAEADRIDNLAKSLDLTVTVRVVEPRIFGNRPTVTYIDDQPET